MSNQEILEFAQNINNAFDNIPVNDILSIWCQYKDLPFSTFDELVQPLSERAEEGFSEPKLKTCKHKFLKGRNTNTQCKTKVKGDGEYCSKRKKYFLFLIEVDLLKI